MLDWKESAQKMISKRGARKYIDGSILENAKPYSKT